MGMNRSLSIVWVLVLVIPFAMALNDKANDEDDDFDYNAAANSFEEYVKKYLVDNGFDQKETIDRDTFIGLFINVTSSKTQTIQGQESNFLLLANKIADKAGFPIKTNDIPSLLNLNELTFIYSSLVEENNITFEDENEAGQVDTKNAEALRKIKEEL